MRVYKVDHVGIAVTSIAEALPVYQALGLSETHREEVPSQGARTSFLPAGESSIELLEPITPDSPVGKFLAKRGPGIHHVCFGVDDIDAALADLAARGYRLIHRQAVPGAGGKRVAFLHPEAGNGVLIELAQKGGL